MEMMFRGVKLTGVEVEKSQGCYTPRRSRSVVCFENTLTHDDRERFESAGYPIYFDNSAAKYFFIVDTVLLPAFNTYKVIDDNKSCECGANAVKASRHSSWCPCN